MSKRLLHLASFNHLLKRKYHDFTCPDPLALINVGDLNELKKNKAIDFFEDVLVQFSSYNPLDDISIRTAISRDEELRKRPYKLYLKPKEHKKNAQHAFRIYKSFLPQNLNMDPNDAWLIFAMSTPELFSGNVCSDVYWPTKVVMEVTCGPIAPLAYGLIAHPERYILDKESGKIEYLEGSNSPVLGKFSKKELDMRQIKQLMELAGTMPCTLEFIYGPVRKINRIAPLIFDVRVLENTKWKFYSTNTIWKISDGNDFLHKLNLIANIAIEKGINENEATLVTSPKGSVIKLGEKEVDLRSLFDIDVFTPKRKESTIKKQVSKRPHHIDDYILKKQLFY